VLILTTHGAVGGQGIASGFRDAIALSWRLAIACRSINPNIDGLLSGWHSERKQQLEASLATTVRNGNMVNTKNPVALFLRDWGLWLGQSLVPPFKRWLELGPRVDGLMRYKYQPGMAFMSDLGGGAMFPQSYCVGLDHDATGQGKVRFTDDVIFSAKKKAMFQIVVLINKGLGELEILIDGLKGIDSICPQLSSAEATFFIRREDVSIGEPVEATKLTSVFRTATAEEFEASQLCVGRPAPREYREHDMWGGVSNQSYVIIRPDRFVFAACSSCQELNSAARGLGERFPCESLSN
jgi:hypothetical protein